jgi:diaminohydroxyphosphoribosylaminopyrimidine deaminase/5-amino-6-(5-phosphoribosylamino)uracil reductase
MVIGKLNYFTFVGMTQDQALTTHEIYMHRCIELARLGAGSVAPNPMVGAILVHNGRIIGEGYHQKFGEAHAEPNCIASVRSDDKHLIRDSAMYVSLEPCAHYGKTPPCADLIISNEIPNVIVGCADPFKQVNGKGIEKLKNKGINVVQGVLEKECRELNKRFFTFYENDRPYIILKWAESANGKIAGPGSERLRITNKFTNRLVHKWRSEESAILVGTTTAFSDNPELTTRLWSGNNPVRLVVDMDLKLSSSLKIFNNTAKTIVFNKQRHEERGHILFYQVTEGVSLVQQITNALYQLKIQSVIVEGGAKLLQSFIDEKMWDEARVIRNEQLIIGNGLASPKLNFYAKIRAGRIFDDRIEILRPQ